MRREKTQKPNETGYRSGDPFVISFDRNTWGDGGAGFDEGKKMKFVKLFYNEEL